MPKLIGVQAERSRHAWGDGHSGISFTVSKARARRRARLRPWFRVRADCEASADRWRVGSEGLVAHHVLLRLSNLGDHVRGPSRPQVHRIAWVEDAGVAAAGA